jgi:Ribonuclease G/E
MVGRTLFLDEGPGETRAVVAIDDAPERLLIERVGEAYPRLGARYVARVARVDRGMGLARLDLGEAGEAALRLKADRPAPADGQKLEVEIAIEPQGDKSAVARPLGEAEGAPRLLAAAPDLAQRLSAFAPGAPILEGRQARDAADEAEAQALAAEHLLAGGGSIAIEPTRALTAIDVDLGSGAGRDARRAARQANLQAIAEAARLLRLKAQAGLVVLDLVGRGHDGQALAQAIRIAFAPDQPGVAIGPVSRFGTIELTIPRRLRPLADILCGEDGAPSTVSLAFRLLRAIEREALADPGGRILARGAPAVVAAAQARADPLRRRLGARFELIADSALPPQTMDASSR